MIRHQPTIQLPRVGFKALVIAAAIDHHYAENDGAELCILINYGSAFSKFFIKIPDESIQQQEHRYHPNPAWMRIDGS